MNSFSVKLSCIAFLISKRNLTIGFVVTGLAAGTLFAAHPTASEPAQTTNSASSYRPQTLHPGENMPWCTKFTHAVFKTQTATALEIAMESFNALATCRV